MAETFALGSAAAPWLKTPNSARSAAMGEAVASVSNDVNSLSVNPAGLASLNGMQVSLLHHAYVVDSSIEHAAVGLSVGPGALALGVDYLNFGAVERYDLDAAGNFVPNGSFSPNGMALNAAYSQKLGSIAAGLNLKMVSQSLDGSSSSSAYGVDLGAQWRQHEKEGIAAGLAVQNLGTALDGASLPMNVKGGASFAMGLREASDILLFALDLNVPSADAGATSYHLGAEYAGGSLWAIRGGYKIAGNGGTGGLSAGAGIQYGIASVDYAFVSQGVLGSSNQVSLTLSF